jgi:hypothetical protein
MVNKLLFSISVDTAIEKMINLNLKELTKNKIIKSKIEELKTLIPSSFAKSQLETNQKYYQILCHRPPENFGIPIELCYPDFANFRKNLEKIDINDNDLDAAIQLTNSMSKFFSNEDARKQEFHIFLENYLNDENFFFSSFIIPNSKVTTDLTLFYILSEDKKIPLANIEVKLEMSTGGSECYLENIGYYSRLFVHYWENLNKISYFPCYLIQLIGPYLSIAGAIFTSNITVDLLTPLIPLFWTPYNKNEILIIAKLLKSFKTALNELKIYYIQLITNNNYIEIDTTFPLIFNTNINNIRNIININQLFKDKLIFQAELINNKINKIIIKFVKNNYGLSLHKFCQELNCAPKIIHYEILNDWKIIIMENLLLNYNCLSILLNNNSLTLQKKQKIKEKLEEIVKKFHNEDLCHGDLRETNIMVHDNDDDDDIIKLVDFDWSGKCGEVYYPPFLNNNIDWPEGVSYNKPILKEHDEYWLKIIINKLTNIMYGS